MNETRILMLAAGLTAIILQAGCSGLGLHGGYDRVTYETDKGIRAQADFINGLIRTAKESAKDDSKFFGFREKQEAETTTRELKPSFLDGLFAPTKEGEK
jgi:hypothetical protein